MRKEGKKNKNKIVYKILSIITVFLMIMGINIHSISAAENESYDYKYVDNYGDERYCYSWRLDHNDRMLVGKKHTESLREMEKKIEADQFDHIVVNGGKLNVLELVEKYISVKNGVRPTTMAG